MKPLVTTLLLITAVLAQTAVVNRLPLPWGIGPDLVVLTVVAVALATTPMTGAVIGFTAGLAVDVLPPADHELGRYAFVLCLAGYLVGYAPSFGMRPYPVAALTAFGVATGFSLIGLLIGDPRVSLAGAASAVLLSVAMTMLVSPLVMLPVGRIMRYLSRDDFASIAGAPWAAGSLRR
ncbi:rod shape-determining protein MreD [Nocardiopsis gilva YIM 90087]|uniref:Rod shape-determining protein MreD n=1 Tax=Nocardiopsis gilva YIM 90087 TaxID=1235441 RepID=A0A223S9L5_9ACTN|nr:rod shape-determining protein MreD [Nocardiopsis gilva]ASU84824.1 rod shape-determining protein MreD [Nocardiopsis gilva YIM 90087]